MKLLTQKLPNGKVEGYCLIKALTKKTSSKGSVFLDLVLADREGEVNAKIWDYLPDVHDKLSPNCVIKVRGTVDMWQDKPQLKVENIRLTTENDPVRMEELVPCSQYGAQEMYDSIIQKAQGFANEDLKAIVLYLYRKYKDALMMFPAAVRMHHAFRGGLLQHILSVCRLAECAADIYPFVDRELLVSGVLLHDLAKVFEFQVGETGIATEYTVEGNLIGHLVRGGMEIDRAAKELGIEGDVPMLLIHMLLSHHGVPEYGSAIRPAFIEAEILSQMDTLDAKIFEMASAVQPLPNGAFSERIWALDNRRIYKHRDMESVDAKL